MGQVVHTVDHLQLGKSHEPSPCRKFACCLSLSLGASLPPLWRRDSARHPMPRLACVVCAARRMYFRPVIGHSRCCDCTLRRGGKRHRCRPRYRPRCRNRGARCEPRRCRRRRLRLWLAHLRTGLSIQGTERLRRYRRVRSQRKHLHAWRHLFRYYAWLQLRLS